MNRIAKYLALTAFAIVIGFATSASAGDVVTLTAVGCFESGECFIVPTAPLTGTTCSDKTQSRFLSTQPGAEFMYKTALSAFLAGKKLAIISSNNCQSNFPRPTYLYIIN